MRGVPGWSVGDGEPRALGSTDGRTRYDRRPLRGWPALALAARAARVGARAPPDYRQIRRAGSTVHS